MVFSFSEIIRNGFPRNGPYFFLVPPPHTPYICILQYKKGLKAPNVQIGKIMAFQLDYKVNKRIKEIMELKEMNPFQFATSIGLKRANQIYFILDNKHGVSLPLIQKVLKAHPDINCAWLVMGEGTMTSKTEAPAPKSELSLLRELLATKDKLIASLEARIKKGK